MKRYLLSIFLIVWAVLGFRGIPGRAATDVTLDLQPNEVQMGAFYNGTTILASGYVPAGAEAVIRISSESEDLHMKKKGKVGGLLWMNTGDLTFHNAPGVYKLYTTKALYDLAYTPGAAFGFTALRDRLAIEPASADGEFLTKELIRLKEREGLYSKEGDAIHFGPAEGDVKPFTARLTIPPSMTQGAYSVEVAAVQNGQLLPSTYRMLTLKQVGFPAQLSDMAFGSSVWYGIMSVVIAVVAGLLMSSLFKSKAGAH